MKTNKFKWLPELKFDTKLPSGLKNRFYYELHVRNTSRLRILGWLGLTVFSLLLVIDYLRYQSGVFHESWVVRALFWNHILGIGLWVVLLYVIYNKTPLIKSGQYNPGPIMNLGLLVIILAVIPQTIFTYLDRGNLILYTVFILAANWCITLTHFERVAFNIGSGIYMVTAILILQKWDTVNTVIHIYEVLGFTSLSFIFNTYDFNLSWQNYYRGVQLAREKKRIENLEAIKKNLYTNLTHEFRTPLTVIRGMSDMAKTYLDNKKHNELPRILDNIDAHADNILNLINQLLNLAQLESSLLTLDLQQKDIVQFLKRIVGMFEAGAAKKHITLKATYGTEPFIMDFDEEKLRSVVTNIISNAIKFNHEGGEICMDFSVMENGSGSVVQIKISDTGYGIGREHLPYIFDRFYQADTGPTRKSTGTGIGLALTKELVELMKGQIEVGSTLGEGTTFTVTLPVTNDAELTDIESEEATPESASKRRASEVLQKDMQKPWLLIVEDNPEVRDYLAELLEQEYMIELAEDGNEGVQKALDIIPDLIISDVMMPGKSGYSLCKELKEHFKTSHIPILLLTAKVTTQDRLDGWGKGADAYMTKPFKAKELKARLENLHQSRIKLREKYQKIAMVTDKDALRKENSFLHDLNDCIEKHMQDRQFSIEGLANALYMSRMQLHRKLKALTGRSASNYVRTYKLHKAKPMLGDLSKTIADVAFDVGFEDPGYFTKVFQKEFGMTPSSFRDTLN